MTSSPGEQVLENQIWTSGKSVVSASVFPLLVLPR